MAHVPRQSSLAPFWKRVGAQPGLLGAALEVAAGLDAAGTAAMLLEPFRIETVAQEHAGGLAAAAGRYGEEWTRSVVDGWFGPGHPYGTDLYEWVDNRLSGLCEALRAAGEPTVARLLVARAWRRMDSQLRLWTSYARAELRQPQLEMLSSPLVRLLEAADDELRDEITAALRTYGDNVVECLMPALRLADARRAAGLDAVARDCAERLGAIIARPPRDEDDWSIAWTGCGCGLCDTLGTFLGSRSRRVFEWPLATGRTPARAHPGRLGRAAGAAPDPAAGASVHAGADQDRRAVHARLGRAAPGRERPGVAEIDAGRRVGVNDTSRYPAGTLCRPVVQICASAVARLSSVSADGPALQIGQSTCT